MTSSSEPNGTPPAAGGGDRTGDQERLSERIERLAPGPGGYRSLAALSEIGDVDRAIYAAVHEVPTPTLDAALRRLSLYADASKLWIGVAAVTAAVGGRRGRQAALDGVVAMAITGVLVNGPLKFGLPRRRPDRELHGVLTDRRVPLPRSPSFPSGHAASAFAFANALGGELPWVALPVRFAAAAVAWSRIHTGVHYPGDVIAGAIVGGAIGEVVGTVRRRLDDRVPDPGGPIRDRTGARTPGC